MRHSIISPAQLLLVTLVAGLAAVPLPAAAQSVSVAKLTDQPDEWFKGEGRRIVDNIVTWQNANGGWWKAYDATQPRPNQSSDGKDGKDVPKEDGNSTWETTSTFDNSATHSELRILARAYRVLKDEKYKQAFDRGMKFIFDAQYPNGGWPQRFPLQDNYGRHITFNDEAMTDVMRLLKDIAEGKEDFAWVDSQMRQRAAGAFDKGLECILDAQIKVNGKLTVWCAQHDAQTLEPVQARSYELPSLSGGESASIVLLLMDIENPRKRVKQAVQAAVRWYEDSKLTGIREVRKPDPRSPKGFDVEVVQDPSAPPLWARFYDLETGKPFFSGRDGVKKSSLAEVEFERRSTYAWLRPWGEKVLKAYPKWARKHGVSPEAVSSQR